MMFITLKLLSGIHVPEITLVVLFPLRKIQRINGLYQSQSCVFFVPPDTHSIKAGRNEKFAQHFYT